MTEKQVEHRAKRKALQELSKIAKIRMNMDLEGMSVNQILVDEFYTDETHHEFKTFHDWKKKGYSVNKGAKSFLIWGKPKVKNSKDDKPKNEDEEEDEFYPLCYLFSNAQVTKKDA